MARVPGIQAQAPGRQHSRPTPQLEQESWHFTGSEPCSPSLWSVASVHAAHFPHRFHPAFLSSAQDPVCLLSLDMMGLLDTIGNVFRPAVLRPKEYRKKGGLEDHSAKAKISSISSMGERYNCIYLPLKEPHTITSRVPFLLQHHCCHASADFSLLFIFQGKLVYSKKFCVALYTNHNKHINQYRNGFSVRLSLVLNS